LRDALQFLATAIRVSQRNWRDCAATGVNAMSTLLPLLIQLASGAIGGNVAGNLLKALSLGVLGNSLAGIVGGGIGGQILQSILGTAASGAGGLDIGSILAQVAGGGVGGGSLMAIIGLLRNMLAK